MEDIEKGLVSLSDEIRTRGIISVAIPPLGSGLGGLVWNDVKKRIVQALTPLTKVHVFLYEPTGSPEPEAMPVGTERPELTLSRALLVSLMAMYKELAYNLSLLEIQKLAYFLQEAGENLKLRYKRFAHGPYAANLNYVLDKLEGHYIRGYGDNQNPMTPIRVLDGAVEEASEFLEHEPEARDRLKRVASVIEGFQTPYGMELLASVHWLAAKETSPATTSSEAYARLIEWKSNARKTYKLSHVEVAWKQLSDTNFLTSKTARH
jgi:hypothetical protein